MLYRAQWNPRKRTWALLALDGRKAIRRGPAAEVLPAAAALGATGLELLDERGQTMLTLMGVSSDMGETMAPWEAAVPTCALLRGEDPLPR